MKKTLMLLISVFLLTGCQSVDEEALKNEIKNEILEELSFTDTFLQDQILDITSDIESYTVAIEVEISGSTSIGSGVIISKDNNTYEILTNEHVIRYADSIEIYVPSLNKYFLASVVKTNADEDLAIISVTTTDSLSIYNIISVDYSVGQLVLAVGTSTSIDYANTITLGIISNISETRIQHDAAINSGNSGGPLFNLNGELIGINVSKINTTSVGNSTINVEGMGFSIPINTIIDFINEE